HRQGGLDMFVVAPAQRPRRDRHHAAAVPSGSAAHRFVLAPRSKRNQIPVGSGHGHAVEHSHPPVKPAVPYPEAPTRSRSPMPHADALERLRHHYQSMPPVAAMGLSIAGYDGERLQLAAPLSRHVNDKGCAFGGSLASMMTLASWGLVSLRVDAAGIAADVYVADSQVRYLAPLFSDIQVTA